MWGAFVNLISIVINLLLDWRQIFVHLRKDILVRFSLHLVFENIGFLVWLRHDILLRAEGLKFNFIGLLFGSVSLDEAFLHIVTSLTKCFISPWKDLVGSALDVETMFISKLQINNSQVISEYHFRLLDLLAFEALSPNVNWPVLLDCARSSICRSYKCDLIVFFTDLECSLLVSYLDEVTFAVFDDLLVLWEVHVALFHGYEVTLSPVHHINDILIR